MERVRYIKVDLTHVVWDVRSYKVPDETEVVFAIEYPTWYRIGWGIYDWGVLKKSEISSLEEYPQT